MSGKDVGRGHGLSEDCCGGDGGDADDLNGGDDGGEIFPFGERASSVGKKGENEKNATTNKEKGEYGRSVNNLRNGTEFQPKMNDHHVKNNNETTTRNATTTKATPSIVPSEEFDRNENSDRSTPRRGSSGADDTKDSSFKVSYNRLKTTPSTGSGAVQKVEAPSRKTRQNDGVKSFKSATHTPVNRVVSAGRVVKSAENCEILSSSLPKTTTTIKTTATTTTTKTTPSSATSSMDSPGSTEELVRDSKKSEFQRLELFGSFDVNGDGFLDQKEIINVCGGDLTEEEIKAVFLVRHFLDASSHDYMFGPNSGDVHNFDDFNGDFFRYVIVSLCEP